MTKNKKLTLEQRYHISAILKANFSLSRIAKNIGVHRSTVLREIKRNSHKNQYDPDIANKKASLRKKMAPKRKKVTSVLLQQIIKLIKKDWSPEQVSGFLKRRNIASISYETIYQIIRKDRQNGGTLYKYLRHGHKKKKKKYGTTENRGQIKNRISIDERPKIVDEKIRIGDWEMDTIFGKNSKEVLVSLVERKTKLTVIRKAISRKAEVVKETVIQMLMPYKDKVFTITTDNGKEFALHEEIGKNLECGVYFAHPYSSWERGLNENTNGLVRQYFPKRTDFQFVTENDIILVEDKLNARPRKTLGYQTPEESFCGYDDSDGLINDYVAFIT